MSRLTLSLKRQWFDEIQNGTKREEYRLATEFWQKRLSGRIFDEVHFTLGYPSAEDASRRMTFACGGIERRMITHPFFGLDPVDVFVIGIGGRL